MTELTAQPARLMGSTEVAALLGVSPATVARAVQMGRLVPSEVTPGGHSRFSESDVKAFRGRGRRKAANAVTGRPLPELADLPLRIDARVRARHGEGLSDTDWRALLSRLDDLSDAIVEIIDKPDRVAERRMAATLAAMSPAAPPPQPVMVPMQVPSVPALDLPLPIEAVLQPTVEPVLPPSSERAPEAVLIEAESPAGPRSTTAAAATSGSANGVAVDTTTFEDGNSGITLIVRPIERFTQIETVSGLLRSIQGVGEIRLRRLQRGVAWFSIRYAGSLPATAVFPRALSSLSAEVTMSGERVFEATLPRLESTVTAAPTAAEPTRA